ncbi:MAG TPA: hypothetical protein VHR72_13605 [Gemmataceae bacterium]|nr:hypothetical protein [Gemmataceae bacterium]
MILAALVVGCGRVEPAAPDTGSREAARTFYQGIVEKNWHKSYDALDAGSKKQRNVHAFARLAESYRTRLGFDPEDAQVQSCEEKGPEAIAHVVLTGHAAAKSRRFKDAALIRKGDDAWQVVLPRSFARK